VRSTWCSDTGQRARPMRRSRMSRSQPEKGVDSRRQRCRLAQAKVPTRGGQWVLPGYSLKGVAGSRTWTVVFSGPRRSKWP
jgi:hypothetical protein